jgi:hypothetical protein
MHQIYWNEQNELFRKIYAQGMANYVVGLPSFKNAFACNDQCLCCIDEGTTGQEHLAGLGILWEDRAELIAALKKAKIKKIVSHTSCGAAMLYARLNNLDQCKADEYGKDFARSIAEELGIKWEHTDLSKMHRPADFHIARIVYYDSTGHFDYTRVKGLPPGFEISRNLADSKHALQELEISIGLAMDVTHGFGNLINEQNPLVICPIGNPRIERLSRGALTEEIANLMPKLIQQFSNRIIVSGFTAPEGPSFLDRIRPDRYFQKVLTKSS